MWGRHAAVVVASNLLAAGLLLAALVYCWPRGSTATRGFLGDYKARRLAEGVNCARPCVKNEVPRECYYEFIIRPHIIVDLSCEEDGQNSSSCISRMKLAPRKIVFAINGKVPGPPIQVCAGDMVVADVWNRVPGQQLSVHWPGLRQVGSPHMDGVPMVTQCPVPAGSRFRYVFRAAEPGTHMYRAHSVSHQEAGVFGAVVVRQPPGEDVHDSLHDHDLEEHTLLLSTAPTAADAAGPPSILISGQMRKGGGDGGARLQVLPGYRYMLRLVAAAAADCPMLLRLDQHPLLVVAKDGHPTSPSLQQQLLLFPGERYDVVLKASQPAATYKMRVKGYNQCSNVYGEAELVYHSSGSNNVMYEDKPHTTDEETERSFLETCPDILECLPPLKGLETSAREPAQSDLRFYLPFDVNTVGDFDGRVDFRYLHEDAPYYPAYLSAGGRLPRLAQFGNVSFLYPPSPLLSQSRDVDAATLCAEDSQGRPLCSAHAQSSFCECTRLLRVPLHSSVELLLVDLGHGSNVSRTFHLHGHAFRLVGRQLLGRPLWPDEVPAMDARGQLGRDLITSPTMDTAVVPNKGYVIWRLRADNPGYWLLESRSGDVADDAPLQLILQVGTEADIPAAPAGFPRCGTFKGPDFLFT